MKLLFLTIDMPHMANSNDGFYGSLIAGLSKKHDITVLSTGISDGFTGMREEGNIRIIRVPSKNVTGNVPLWKKGYRLVSLSRKYINAYNTYLKSEIFDFVFMSTPPMNFVDVVTEIKKKSNAKLYLLLRDIHPQSSDRKTISTALINNINVYEEAKKPYSINPIIYKYLYLKAQKLYKIADVIGCMSPANCKFIKSIAPYVDDSKLKVVPNWYPSITIDNTLFYKNEILKKHGLEGKFIAIFGGVIGAPQAVWNIASLAKHNVNKPDVVFLVVGRGPKMDLLKQMAQKDNIRNIKFIDYVPHEEYVQILKCVDIGLISLDEKYTVPTCPSKIIGYMAFSKPVLAIFNKGNDYGEYYIDRARCGLWSVDLNYKKYFNDFDIIYYDSHLRRQMGKNGYDFYKNNLTVERITDLINEQLT